MIEFLNHDELKPWEKNLVDAYPLIYREPNPELRDFYTEDRYQKLIKDPNFTNLRYGFEFGEGWAKLVDKFSQIAQELVVQLRCNKIQSDACIHACIFKEKMGHLTWQGDNNLIEPFKSLFRAYVIEIERESSKICELTGEYGCECVRGGWHKILCYKKGRELGFEPVAAYYRDQWKSYDKQTKSNDSHC